MKKLLILILLIFNACAEKKQAVHIIAENKGWLIRSKNICEFSVNQFWKKDGSFCCAVTIHDDCDKWKIGDTIDLYKYLDTIRPFVVYFDSLMLDTVKVKFEHEVEPDSSRQWLIPRDSIYSTLILKGLSINYRNQ